MGYPVTYDDPPSALRRLLKQVEEDELGPAREEPDLAFFLIRYFDTRLEGVKDAEGILARIKAKFAL